MPAPKDQAASATCPRCARVLPPGISKVCIYCGTPLAVTPARIATAPPRSARDALSGQTVAGRFKIEELIGQGGMGKVYRARHLALDRLVCLKMLKPALLEDPTLVGRFEREAKAASRLNHPNSIQVLDFGKSDVDGSLYIVMELVQGKDLRILLRDEWPLAEERLCKIMAQVLAALGEAHASKVIHRDLKPENVMVEQRRGRPDFVKVLDFGIAKILDSDMPGLTRHDVVCGTPQYMAPEQATGSQLDARCDLYAVGVILYQMATGHLPFDGQNSMEVLTKHVNEKPIPPRQRKPDAPISEAMQSLILRALEKEPALRPQTAEEFRELLLQVPQQRGDVFVFAGTPHTVTPATHPSALKSDALSAPVVGAPRPLRRKRAAIAFGVAIAGLCAAMLVIRARPSPPSPPAPPVATSTPAASLPAPAAPLPPVERDTAKARELVQRAADWQANNDTGTARDLLEQAIRLDPDNAEAHYRLGGLFLNSQTERARSEYQAAKRLNRAKYGDVVDTILKGL